MAITKINTPELFDLGTTNSSLRLPSGDTASRPSNPNTGEWRYNTDDNYVEYWDGTAWFQIDYETAAPTCTTDTINYPSGTTNTAYYKMSDATDSTLNGYNGTATNVNFNVQGKFGNAGEFNGSSSLINLGNNAAINTLPTTISCWINTTTTASESTIWNNGGNSSSNTGLALVILSSGVLRLTTSNSSGTGAQVTGTTSINDGNWHHIVITYEAGGASGFTASGNCYLDGNITPEFTSNVLANFTQANQNFIIGRYWASGLGYFNGKIDQVRIFPSALTAANVTSLYNEGTVVESTDGTDSILQFIGGTGTVTFS